ncbi:Ger(x)C family spore germination protein [Natronincola ferrireducens]|uniref:Germination protein, Ger(X)C family n=1 Tax=Natronincola ferrireducens TaxID=393762 RepID=A0A1G9FD53_9FIRM|nr:Ger(x)C family spore germination protein [Natronincola ferrireducens]SDK86311.1 germination protein, Ger(x)C family [Natronincola ferrireducens]
MRKKMILLMVLAIAIVLTGCWDAIEIDKRGYVMVLGVDKYEAPSPQEEEEVMAEAPRVPKDTPRNRYSFTYVLPNLSFINGEGGDANIVYSTVGESLYGATRILSTRINRQVFFGHMKVVVIDEKVARDAHMFQETLDAIERDPLISRRVHIAITPNTAKEVLGIEPQINPMTGDFLKDLFLNKDRSPRSGGGVIGDIFEELRRWGNIVIPRIVPGEEDIKVAGSAVFKDYQMVGWLGEVETRALEILRGTARPGGLTVRYQNDTEYIVPVDLIYLSSITELDDTSDKIKIKKEIRTEGNIQQFAFLTENDLLESQIITEIEALVSEKLEKELKDTIEKLQKEFEVDVLGIDDYISKYYPKFWAEVEEDWQEIFPNIEIEVDVNTIIRRMGLTK